MPNRCARCSVYRKKPPTSATTSNAIPPDERQNAGDSLSCVFIGTSFRLRFGSALHGLMFRAVPLPRLAPYQGARSTDCARLHAHASADEGGASIVRAHATTAARSRRRMSDPLLVEKARSFLDPPRRGILPQQLGRRRERMKAVRKALRGAAARAIHLSGGTEPIRGQWMQGKRIVDQHRAFVPLFPLRTPLAHFVGIALRRGSNPVFCKASSMTQHPCCAGFALFLSKPIELRDRGIVAEQDA